MFKKYVREPMLVLDMETGGLNPGVNPILTIGMVVFKTDGSAGEEIYICISPEGRPVEPAALEKNKINLEEHERLSVSSKEAVTLITDFVRRNFGDNKPCVMGHNIAFDLRFLEELIPNLYQDLDQPSLFFAGHKMDTQSMAMELYQEGILLTKTKKLDKLCSTLGLQYGTSHNALDDAIMCARLYKKLRELKDAHYGKLYSRRS